MSEKIFSNNETVLSFFLFTIFQEHKGNNQVLADTITWSLPVLNTIETYNVNKEEINEWMNEELTCPGPEKIGRRQI